MKLSLLLMVVMMSGCVVRQYGSGAATANTGSAQLAPVDFSDVESRLEELIAGETENVDRRDRLEAAWELCQESKTQRPAAQHAVHRYLVRLVEVERRVIDADTDALANPELQTFIPIAAIQSERIAGSEAPAAAPAAARKSIVPPDAGAQAVMSSARDRMASGDLKGALSQLDVCTGQPCGAATITLWREVRDRLVYQAREQAGQAFIDARTMTDPSSRRAEYQRIVDELTDLQTRFPDSRYNEGVTSSIETVRSALSEEGD